MTDLTPREHAIVELARGRSPLAIAGECGVPEEAVRALGRQFGWPGDVRALKRAAQEIRRGETQHAGWDGDEEGQPQPAAEATDDAPPECPDDCGGCSCHLGNSAPCSHCVEDHDDIDGRRSAATPEETPMPGPGPLDDTTQVLDLLDQPTPTDRAVLTMPLARLVSMDADVTVVEAVVDVQLAPGAVLAILDGVRSPASAVNVVVTRRVTAEGADAIRELAALLDVVDAVGGDR